MVTLVTAELLALFEWRDAIEAQFVWRVTLTVLSALASALTRPIPTRTEPV